MVVQWGFYRVAPLSVFCHPSGVLGLNNTATSKHFALSWCEHRFTANPGHGIYNVTGILFSHVLTHIAVPTFYFISGFLFFINFYG